MSDADLRVCCFLGHDETQQSTHCSHHFKQRVCLCLLSQCCVFRNAARIPPSVWRGSCWPLKECNFHVSRVRTSVSQRWNEPFHGFAFVCLSFKSAGQAALKSRRQEVLHQILWRDGSGSHHQFFCRPLTADVRTWLHPVEAVPRVSRTTDGELIMVFTPSIAKWFCSVHQWSARVLSTAGVFSTCPPHSNANQCL